MPQTNYINIKIGGTTMDVEQVKNVPISVSYSLEDLEDFQQKNASTALDITVPITQNNSKAANTLHNPSIEDLTNGEFFKKPQDCVISANGVELLHGKAFIKSATHTDKPGSLKIDAYGNNGDWVIQLQDKTLADFVNPVPHTLNKSVMQASWAYDGTNEVMDYVYAPVRYKQPFDSDTPTPPTTPKDDLIVRPLQLCPSISIYWIIVRAFRSIGYKLSSQFMDSPYFRRLVMPWTWGSFLYLTDAALSPFKFRALCNRREIGHNGGTWHEFVSPDIAPVDQTVLWTDVSSGGATGGYINTPGCYTFNPSSELVWQYLPALNIGRVEVTLGGEINWAFAGGGPFGGQSLNMEVYWYVNGINVAIDLIAGVGPKSSFSEAGYAKYSRAFEITPGTYVSCRFRINSDAGSYTNSWFVGTNLPGQPSYFELISIKRVLGSDVVLTKYDVFKNYNFLDMFRGVVDNFNLLLGTDSNNRTIVIEPSYPYYTGSNPLVTIDGYYKKERLDWSSKQDLSKESTVDLYADAERDFRLLHKDDGNDGCLKVLNERIKGNISEAKYLFPERFKAGKKEIENRFFSAIVHVNMPQWGDYSTSKVQAQLIALIPENVSNTSAGEVAQVFEPKMAYYKGLIDKEVAGGWNWDGSTSFNMPFMFAVNYKDTTGADPVLTYSDQRVGYGAAGIASSVGAIAHGLMRRFYLSRFAVMRYGKLYSTWMRLDMNDITNWQHREAIMVKGANYYLISIDGFKPLIDETTGVKLWKYWPTTQDDLNSCFPSSLSLKGSTTLASDDIKYAPSLIYYTDLPQK